ncbi:MAG: DUF4926 domain-containing protein [Deltaproteobacteria bacterium]|nr:MAG: DUF4926 domain-containing protein [Deltaproteobacteria bacterium]
MAYPLFARVAFREDFSEYSLRRGDIATVVEQHEGGESLETGYSLEVFNAVGETMAVLVVGESQTESLRQNEIFHIRRFDEAMAA